MVKPRTIDARSEKFSIWRSSIVLCETAVILIGTLAILSSRLSAVTTISDSVLSVSTVGPLGALGPGASLAKAYGRNTQAAAITACEGRQIRGAYGRSWSRCVPLSSFRPLVGI